MNEEAVLGIDPFTGLPYLRYEKIRSTGGGGGISDLSGFTTDDLAQGSNNLYSQWNTYIPSGTETFYYPKTSTNHLIIGSLAGAQSIITNLGASTRAIFTDDTNNGLMYYALAGYGYNSFLALGAISVSGHAGGVAGAETATTANSWLGVYGFMAHDDTVWSINSGAYIQYAIPGFYGQALSQPSANKFDFRGWLGGLTFEAFTYDMLSSTGGASIYLNRGNATATTTIGSAAGTAVTVDGGTGTVTHGFTTVLSGGLRTNYTSQAGDYNVLTTDYMIDCTASLTVTLPDATAIVGQTYVIKNSGSGTITIATTSAQTIDGSASATISVQYVSITVVSDGANWKVI